MLRMGKVFLNVTKKEYHTTQFGGKLSKDINIHNKIYLNMKKTITLVLVTILFSCSNNDDSNDSNCKDKPSLQTFNATNVIGHKAIINGKIEPPTCEDIYVSSKGFVYSKTPNPTILNDLIWFDSNETEISLEISNLELNQTYYVRTFLSDYVDTYYGNQISFETNTNGLTYIPDDAFEIKLIELGYDDRFDNYVITRNITEVTGLVLNNLGISDLTGIEDFTSLWKLDINNNNLSSIDLTKNIALQYLEINYNELYSLDLTQNINLWLLRCIGNNLTNLNLSNQPNFLILNGNSNNLEFVNLANGNNINMHTVLLNVGNASNLCVQIDNGFTPPSCNGPDGWCISETAHYSFNCE